LKTKLAPEPQQLMSAQLSSRPCAKLVTVSVGGNDVSFSKVLIECLSRMIRSPCTDVIQEQDSKLPALLANLTDLDQDIRSHAPVAVVIGVGCPYLLDAPFKIKGVANIHL
jgi:lysophospholipase L1-like esterase